MIPKQFMENLLNLKKGIPWPQSYCNCCKQHHCDHNGKEKPSDQQIADQWELAKTKNICPHCGEVPSAAFWLRGDVIECSQCR